MVRCHCQSTSAHNCCECMSITREAQQVWPAPGDTPEVDVLPDKPLWHVTTSLARHPQFPQFSIGQGSVMRLYNHHMFALHLWSLQSCLKAGGFKGVVCMRNHNACTIQGLMHSPLQQGTVLLAAGVLQALLRSRVIHARSVVTVVGQASRRKDAMAKVCLGTTSLVY